jgi:hypothetical protein
MNTWGMRGTLAAIGVAAVIGGLGGTAIYAATGNDVHVMGMHGPPPGGGPGPGHDVGASIGSDPAAALHGEYVVSDDKGGYTTMLAQTGTVTALAPASVTARSADGFTQTYALPKTVTTDVAVDDEVVIRATRAGAAATPTISTIKQPMLGH